MKGNRETLIAVSFILLSAGSSLYLLSITLNYLNYYPALEHLSANVDSMTVVQGSNWSRINSQITIANPTDYSGIRLAEADISMFFQVNSTVTLFTDYTIGTIATVSGQLGPHSVVNSNVVTQLNPQNASALKSFSGNYTGRVMANVTLTVYVVTFLDPVFGRIPISASEYLPLLAGLALPPMPQSLTSTAQFSNSANRDCRCWKYRT